MILDFGQRLIKFVSLQRVHKFFHCGTGGEPVYIQLGMFPEKFPVRGNVHRIRIPMIKKICHDFF